MFERIRSFYHIAHKAAKLFIQNDPLRMAGATAFFTTFALPPILIIIVQLFGYVVDPMTVRRGLYNNLSGIVGREAVVQIVSVIRAFRTLAQTNLAFILGFVFLLFVATTLFKVIRSSINQIWSISSAHSTKRFRSLRNRFKAVLIIILSGLLFVVGIFTETLQLILNGYVMKFSSSFALYLNNSISLITSLLIAACWFLMIFRFLTAERPAWSVAWKGALFTGFLFSIGKFVLHVLLTYNNVTTIYGASASLVLLLLFVFYFSMILYYGASFTKVLAEHHERKHHLSESSIQTGA